MDENPREAAPGDRNQSPLGAAYRDSYTLTFEPGECDQLSTAIVRAVSTIEGVRPADLDETLYESVDPDVLDLLFGSRGGTTNGRARQLCFTLCGHEVAVRGAGTVTIYERPAAEMPGDDVSTD